MILLIKMAAAMFIVAAVLRVVVEIMRIKQGREEDDKFIENAKEDLANKGVLPDQAEQAARAWIKRQRTGE